MKMARARLDKLAAMRAPLRGGVITYRADEAPEDAAARAVASGRVGPFLAVLAPVSVEQWAAGAAQLGAYQAQCRAEWEAQRHRAASADGLAGVALPLPA